jgi:hypothetical protein
MAVSKDMKASRVCAACATHRTGATRALLGVCAGRTARLQRPLPYTRGDAAQVSAPTTVAVAPDQRGVVSFGRVSLLVAYTNTCLSHRVCLSHIITCMSKFDNAILNNNIHCPIFCCDIRSCPTCAYCISAQRNETNIFRVHCLSTLTRVRAGETGEGKLGKGNSLRFCALVARALLMPLQS